MTTILTYALGISSAIAFTFGVVKSVYCIREYKRLKSRERIARANFEAMDTTEHRHTILKWGRK